MVVLMGPDWAGVQPLPGETPPRRSIDNEFDFVRREVMAALDTGAVIVPVLVPGGRLASALHLGPEFLTLEETQALELSPRHWKADVDTLIEAIRGALAESTK